MILHVIMNNTMLQYNVRSTMVKIEKRQILDNYLKNKQNQTFLIKHHHYLRNKKYRDNFYDLKTFNFQKMFFFIFAYNS